MQTTLLLRERREMTQTIIIDQIDEFLHTFHIINLIHITDHNVSEIYPKIMRCWNKMHSRGVGAIYLRAIHLHQTLSFIKTIEKLTEIYIAHQYVDGLIVQIHSKYKNRNINKLTAHNHNLSIDNIQFFGNRPSLKLAKNSRVLNAYFKGVFHKYSLIRP